MDATEIHSPDSQHPHTDRWSRVSPRVSGPQPLANRAGRLVEPLAHHAHPRTSHRPWRRRLAALRRSPWAIVGRQET